MKKFAQAAAAAAVALSFSVSGAQAGETGVSDLVDDVCKPLVEAGVLESVGKCIGSVNKNQAAFCKEFAEIIGFKNTGACVSTIRKAINDADF